LEASPVIGGKLRLGEVGGIYLDLGVEALLACRPEAMELIQAVGLGEEVICPHTMAAAIWSQGALHPLPGRPSHGHPG
jgi:oxygen-dependent protoporphyrinogen oxidase